MPRSSKSLNDELILNAALEGLVLQRQRIEEQIADIRGRLGQRGGGKAGGARAGAGRPRRKRVLSPEARKRIAAAQKKRWAEFRKKAGKEG